VTGFSNPAAAVEMYKGRSKVDADGKLLSAMQLPEVLGAAVDAGKVNLAVMDGWVERELKRELGFEDDILVGMVCNKLRENPINVKALAVELSAFLQRDAALAFLTALWALLLEAQESPDGLPRVLVQERMKEIEQRQRAKRRSRSPPPAVRRPGKQRDRSRNRR